MMPPEEQPHSLDLARLPGGPFGTFLYGPSRTVLLRVAFAFARANDSRPYWVDVRDPNEFLDPPGPVELGWIPDDHLFVVSRSEAKPQDAVSNLALWTVVRSDEPRSVIGGLTDFLRLPPPIQEALSRYGQESFRPVFVVANTDRVREYYPRNVPGVRAIIEAMIRGGVLPIFASQGLPGPGRLAFDLVFEVTAPDLAHWREGALRCEKAPEGTPFQPAERVPLESMPGVVAALEGRPNDPAAPA
ncbi:MAG: hypothetical protein L3K14_09365 [Thermoplasmata archaeon]|nr:hypothetical protein [Thermoplasmata archaeon]